MKRLVIALFATVLCWGIMVDSAEARRLGGGKSFGMNRNSSVMNREAAPVRPVTPAQNAAPSPTAGTTPAAPPRTGMSRWLGPIAGLAAGIGLAAMLSHFGLGEGVANFLMIVLLAMAAVFLLRRFFGKRAPEATTMQYEYAGAGSPAYSGPAQFEAAKVGAGSTAMPASAVANVPADFDVGGFLRQAKLNFVRMQAANDRGDMEDIRLFSTPEVAAEIQMQYQERGCTPQHTDVVQLNADLLGIDNEAARHVASVRFYGQLREEANGAPGSFVEVWHLVKPVDGERGWLVAGIQQD